ncbi:MAG: hypothetical protein M3Y22_08400 [Pseudomonadota bacterium]|nr:hypothetical protein [Pseudomonadota bacterium]
MEVETGEGEVTLEASFDGLEPGLVAERLDQDLSILRTISSGKRLAMAAAASLQVDGDVLIPRALGPFKQALDLENAPWTGGVLRPNGGRGPERRARPGPGKRCPQQTRIAQSLGWRGCSPSMGLG